MKITKYEITYIWNRNLKFYQKKIEIYERYFNDIFAGDHIVS